MDSVSTLVSSGPQASKATLVQAAPQGDVVLAFTPDNMRNTTVRLQTIDGSGSGTSGEVLYSVSTSSDLNVTEVYRGDLRTAGEKQGVVPMAKIQRNTFLPDTITFDGEKKKLSAWLKTSLELNQSKQGTRHTLNAQGMRYLWKSDMLAHVACFAADAENAEPVAWYISNHAGPNQRVAYGNRPGVGYLHLTHIGDAIRDDLVASLLIVQQDAWVMQDNLGREGPRAQTVTNNTWT